jgi:hypothetical protein
MNKPIRELQDLRAMVMTKKRESTGGNPPSGQQEPEMLVLAPFTPRKNRSNKFRREKKQMGRVSHGSTRAIEGLRGLRLSLVPQPSGRENILQGV